jgi:hypothetical protein
MSDLDDLEEIAEQFRHTVNEPRRPVTKKQREAFRHACEKGARANRSVEKQQFRSSDRRRVLASKPNQE